MQSISANILLSDIFVNVDLNNLKNEPLRINTSDFSGLIISDSNWKDIEETLNLLAINGMRDSLIEGMNTPLSECSDSLEW